MKINVPEKLGFSSERLKRIDTVMQRYIDKKKLAGIVALVARCGSVVHFSKFGMQDIEANKPMALDTVFRIYSMTKPITSVALMMLYERGRFQLDAPVANFIPAFNRLRVYTGGNGADMQGRKPAAPMTIKHLLTHTSGLTYGFLEEDEPVAARYRELGIGGLAGSGNLASLMETLADLPPPAFIVLGGK